MTYFLISILRNNQKAKCVRKKATLGNLAPKPLVESDNFYDTIRKRTIGFLFGWWEVGVKARVQQVSAASFAELVGK